MPEVTEKAWIMSNWQNYIQGVFDHDKQSTDTYHLNMEGEGDIMRFRTALSRDVPRICENISDHLDVLQ